MTTAAAAQTQSGLAINIRVSGSVRIARIKGVFDSVPAALDACKLPPDRQAVEVSRLDRALRAVGVADFEWCGKEFRLSNGNACAADDGDS